jgi:sulfatase maturation enzyme AslB (radical SAM superfamily)
MERETKIQTLSLVVGNEICNARCPFCISKMTPTIDLTRKEPGINWQRFSHAVALAREGNASSVMLTGKGEPTLFPQQISQYLEHLREIEGDKGYEFPAKELQTNGIIFEKQIHKFNLLLAQ